MRTQHLTIPLLAIAAFPLSALDLTRARVKADRNEIAATVLTEEVEKRTGVQWPMAGEAGSGVEIALTISARSPAEGFRLSVRDNRVEIIGNDARGLLFGVGRLLRELTMDPGSVTVKDNLLVETAPRYSLRGHQLGYRPKTNSYDGWTVPMWEQYMRDLAVFGTNAVELLPPRTDDDADSPHFPIPPLRMMVEMSRIAHRYHMQVWVWYPALDKDYADPATVEFALKEWGEVFRQLPHIDAVFVPGGDPGHTQPKHLMALLEKQTANLRRYHPSAQMWVSPQGFSAEWLKEFYALLKPEPAWLHGVVYAPQMRMTMADLRRDVPKRYPIRNYPDITHSTHAQHVVPDWDLAYAKTHGREPINPRPRDMATVFHHEQPATIGFLTYSEGCNDDVNKIVWSALGWDPEANLAVTLREYGRYFLSARLGDGFGKAILALEENWRGPVASNSRIETTLAQFQSLERAATPKDKLSWRFQMALYRAYFDAFERRRLLHEVEAEQRARDHLRKAPSIGSAAAIAVAEAEFARGLEAPATDWRARIFELAEALYQSARMQLSVSRYEAIGQDRGATLDNVDIQLNDRGWWLDTFTRIRSLESEALRLEGLRNALEWTNPGAGGYYDDLGNPSAQPHLVKRMSYAEDPGYMRHSFTGFGRRYWERNAWRRAWLTVADAMWDTPVELEYRGLDPSAKYLLRFVWGGEPLPARVMNVTADDRYELMQGVRVENLTEPVEAPIPVEATADGVLRVKWWKTPGLPGSGRGCQVAEVWLVRAAER